MQAGIRMVTALLIGCLAFKIMFFLRIWSNLGKLVQLIIRVLQDAVDFTFFFFGWIYVFVLLNKILGAEFSDGDYPEFNEFFVMIIQTYRNSIGDIAPPTYDLWTEENTLKDYPNTSTFMILVIWVAWFMNQYFNLIILLNFLIAIIS